MKHIITRRRLFGALILASLFLFAFAPLVQGDFSSLEEFLSWVAVGGGAMWLAGTFIAMFLENLAFWHSLPGWVKTVFPLLAAAVVGALAQSVLALELLAGIPPIIQTILLMLLNWVFGQRTYARIKDSAYGESARLKAAARATGR